MDRTKPVLRNTLLTDSTKLVLCCVHQRSDEFGVAQLGTHCTDQDQTMSRCSDLSNSAEDGSDNLNQFHGIQIGEFYI